MTTLKTFLIAFVAIASLSSLGLLIPNTLYVRYLEANTSGIDEPPDIHIPPEAVSQTVRLHSILLPKLSLYIPLTKF